MVIKRVSHTLQMVILSIFQFWIIIAPSLFMAYRTTRKLYDPYCGLIAWMFGGWRCLGKANFGLEWNSKTTICLPTKLWLHKTFGKNIQCNILQLFLFKYWDFGFHLLWDYSIWNNLQTHPQKFSHMFNAIS